MPEMPPEHAPRYPEPKDLEDAFEWMHVTSDMFPEKSPTIPFAQATILHIDSVMDGVLVQGSAALANRIARWWVKLCVYLRLLRRNNP